ncbi:type 2 lanthipeptide synthetase LanM family protein [Bacillus cereus]|uniref:type 2 lanthipeptide synthetase LanM family protein n=1 Tax=Bacillus cereus TaxID=1396 RepID=UPI00283A9808|nr:type 2 lanthipeptide synthetase LanM family protein [Bacillus cereus]
MSVKHSAFIDEIKTNDQIVPDSTDYINYWKKTFENNENKFEGILKDLSGIQVSTLSQLEHDEYSVDKVDALLSLTFSEFDSFQTYEFPPTIEEHLSKATFYGFFKKFMSYSFSKVHKSLNTYSFFEESQLLAPLEYMYKRLYELSHKTLILELNIQRVLENLKGETPEERYNHFCSYISTNEFFVYFKDTYPALYRTMLTTLIHWSNNIITLYYNLEQDKVQIQETFNIDTQTNKLITITLGLGDEHNDGKTVSLIEFLPNIKLIYKPRSIGVEAAFNDLTAWINNQVNDKAQLYSPKIIDKHSYGWVEYIDNIECQTEEQLKTFYFKMGSLLGVLYSLNAVDFHYENIIAMGEYPVPIDLESLFHHAKILEEKDGSAHNKALNLINRSVRSTGIIPFLAFNSDNPNYKGLDLSGLSDKNDQLYPLKVPSIESKNTDVMHVDAKYKYVKVNEFEKNKPIFKGEKVSYKDHVDVIIDGFKYIYEWILNNKQQYSNYISDKFKNTIVRMILRPTAVYGELLRKSKHPDFLQKGYNRDIYFHTLALEPENKPKEIIKSEKTDLLNDDIPYFYTTVSSNHLYHREQICIQNFFESSPLEAVIQKIDDLNIVDCSQQIRIMRMSFLAHSATFGANEQAIDPYRKVNIHANKSKEFLIEARHIGDYLIANAIEGNDQSDLCWISTVISASNEYKWDIYPVDLDLYNGLSGISLFFSYLYHLTGRNDYKLTAEKSIYPVINSLQRLPEQRMFNIGTFSGVSGSIYALNHINQLSHTKQYEQLILDSMKIVVSKLSQDKVFDIIDGTAGVIGVLIALYKDSGNKEYLKLLKQASEYLINAAYHHPGKEEHVSWKQRDDISWIGYSHGTAGIITALVAANQYINNPNILELADKVLSYENSFYDPKHKNWKLPSKDNHSVAWCHGAPGILLSRLMLKESNYENSILDQNIYAALDTTIDKSFGHNRSLCHGDFGNLDILLYAAKVLQDKTSYERANSIGIQLLEYSKTHNWKKGVSTGTESFGLMTGLSGIGVGLLQQSDYNSIPSILRLEEAKL